VDKLEREKVHFRTVESVNIVMGDIHDKEICDVLRKED